MNCTTSKLNMHPDGKALKTVLFSQVAQKESFTTSRLYRFKNEKQFLLGLESSYNL